MKIEFWRNAESESKNNTRSGLSGLIATRSSTEQSFSSASSLMVWPGFGMTITKITLKEDHSFRHRKQVIWGQSTRALWVAISQGRRQINVTPCCMARWKDWKVLKQSWRFRTSRSVESFPFRKANVHKLWHERFFIPPSWLFFSNLGNCDKWKGVWKRKRKGEKKYDQKDAHLKETWVKCLLRKYFASSDNSNKTLEPIRLPWSSSSVLKANLTNVSRQKPCPSGYLDISKCSSHLDTSSFFQYMNIFLRF